jgi:O-antigen ligase
MTPLPWLTAYLVLLLGVPSTQIVGPLGSAGSLSMVFGLGGVLLWLVLRAAASHRAPTGPQPVRRALLFFLLCVGLTYAWTMSHPVSPDEVSPADVAVLAVVSWTGTFLIAHDTVDTTDDLRTLLRRIALSGGFLALLGLLQAFTRQTWVDRFSIPGLTVTQAANNFERGGFPRPAGTSVHPIEFGVVIAVLFPIALHIAFHDTQRALLIRWFPAAAIGALIPLTSSRSAYLGALVGVTICMTAWDARRRRQMLGVAGLGVAAMLVVTPNLLNSIFRLFSGASDDPSVTSRTDSFDLASGFIERSPVLGRGLGTFLPKYRIFDNQYLLLLVTIGILGTLGFLSLAVVALRVLVRVRTENQDAATKDLATSLIASVVVGFLSLALFDAFAFPQTMGTMFLLLGVVGALGRLRTIRSQDPEAIDRGLRGG